MDYPGSSELSQEARDRVLTAFQQVLAKLQEGRPDEAAIGLEFVLRLDGGFAPALQLQRQLQSGGGGADLSSMVELLQGSSDEEVEGLLIEAVEDFDERRLLAAREKVDRVLREVPGHEEARHLRQQVAEALRIEAQVGSHLAAAQEAIEDDRLQEAAELVMLAQALEPRHPGLPALIAQLERGPSADAGEPPAEHARDHEAAEPPADGGFTFSLAGEQPPATDSGLSDTLPTAASQGEEFSFGEAGPAPGASAPVDEGVADVADLFATGDSGGEPALEPAGQWRLEGEGSSPFAGDAAAKASPEDEDRVRGLLEQGRSALERGDYQDAIDAFSRVFLVDPSHPVATQLVEEARQRKDEVDRTVEHTLYEAQDAADAGRRDEALRLVDEVLALQPAHIGALDLKERLAPAATGSPPGARASAEAPPAPADEGEAALPDLVDSDELFDDATTVGLPERRGTPPVQSAGGRRLPLRMIGLALAALLVIALGAFFGTRLLGGGNDEGDAAAVERVLRQAEELYQQGRVEEAVHLLQEYPATGLEQSRIAVRLSKYQQALTPPTPTPVPQQLPQAQEALADGRLLEALRVVGEGLAVNPRDPGLLELRDRIQQQEPLLAALQRAQAANDWETSASVARDLMHRYPERPELEHELERSLFNYTVALLRAYNLPGAAGPISELARRRPGDTEVQRIAEFIEQYRSRPVDMQQRIFVASLATR